MAGPSSKTRYLNIGTIQTLNYPKLEPEIEVVEAIGDSDEVCSLEGKECDKIMEHLKNNSGLVVKSLGLERQIVLHVVVTTSETKKAKPRASKSTKKGFNNAAVDSKWYLALRDSNCNALISLLEANPCLVAQIGPKERTILHVAAHRGCLQLLYQVFDVFKNYDEFVDEKSEVKVYLNDLRQAKCCPFKAKAQDMAWFTFPRYIWIKMYPYTLTSPIHPGSTRSSSGASQYVRDKLVEIMQGEPSKVWTEDLESGYQSDANYNFVLDLKELQFHYACGVMWTQMNKTPLPETTASNYVKAVIGGCQKLGPSESNEVLKHLFQLHNAQGQTLVHVVSKCGRINQLLRIMGPLGNAYKECLNAKDVRGWTILHFFVATQNHRDLEVLLNDEQVDLNARTSISEGEQIDENTPTSISKDDQEEVGMTALHLAILHNDVKSVELLLQHRDTNVTALLYRRIVCGYERSMVGDDYEYLGENTSWSPLQLAAIMGLSNIVKALLTSTQGRSIYGDEHCLNDPIDRKEMSQRVSSLLLASTSGDLNTLRLFLDNPEFDPLVTFHGAISLHYATHAMIPRAKEDKRLFESYKVDYFLYNTDLGYLDRDTCRYKEESKDIKLTEQQYRGRQACITMLLQVGVDIWGKDENYKFAGPGPQAPIEAHLWWHGKIAQETLEVENSLNNTANAISVVVALVATASYVGPLQPPLGYGGDSIEGGVQDTHLSIRVFMVSNNLSFYFAIASIMFAIVPSLPMPQEGIYSKSRRWRLRTFGLATFFLLMSILCVLISFGAASNSVVS